MRCTRCGKSKPDDQYKTCGRCRAIRRAAKDKRLAVKAELEGRQICRSCEQPMEDAQHRVCDACREAMRQNRDGPSLKVLETVAWMRQIMASTPCADCQAIKGRMAWDHLPGTTKLGNVSDFVWAGQKEKAIEEMAKCELVCIACHGRRGMQRGQLQSIH